MRTIFHHTAGHVPNLGPGETYAEACAYARAIQNYHMNSNGWNDSGHNFLVTRGGYILEGRHGSLASIGVGKMVVSAHCPTQNTQPGVEHEHDGVEAMTPIERAASVWLHAWICKRCDMSPADCAQPHRKYYATSCPGNLATGLSAFRKDVADLLSPVDDSEAWYDKYGPKKKPVWFFRALQEYARRLDG